MAGMSQETVADRIKLLSVVVAGRVNIAALARWLDEHPNRLTNITSGGMPLSKRLADIILARFSGIDYGWLWHGYTDGLSDQMTAKLEKARQLIRDGRNGRTRAS